jgi:hypothetical protein
MAAMVQRVQLEVEIDENPNQRFLDEMVQVAHDCSFVVPKFIDDAIKEWLESVDNKIKLDLQGDRFCPLLTSDNGVGHFTYSAEDGGRRVVEFKNRSFCERFPFVKKHEQCTNINEQALICLDDYKDRYCKGDGGHFMTIPLCSLLLNTAS